MKQCKGLETLFHASLTILLGWGKWLASSQPPATHLWQAGWVQISDGCDDETVSPLLSRSEACHYSEWAVLSLTSVHNTCVDTVFRWHVVIVVI